MSISTSPRFDHTEGTVARTIEDQTAKLPSDIFLWAAVASMAVNKPQPVVLFDVVKGWLTGSTPHIGEIYEVKK